MPTKKPASKTKQQIHAGRDVNIVELGTKANAAQVAAGETVKQNKTLQAAPESRDVAIISDAVRVAAQVEPAPVAQMTLDREIKMLRRMTKKVARLIKNADSERAPVLLNALSMASTRVAVLLKAQKDLTGKDSDVAELLLETAQLVLQEKRAQGGGNH